ncbi:MAG: hypothetical protein MMC33_010606, partial [Icmadophila ericetorum]|nr:hypothetical protein [Icmadophila ericetorum]
MVTYGYSVRGVQALAQALGCEGYYHYAARKAAMLQAFMSGRQRMMVATSALGLEIDIPDIRVIVHMDRPRKLLDYAQESGRAGRDRLGSEAIIVSGGWNGEESGRGEGRL